YVSLKASRLGNFKNRVIIGVNNVQAQMEVQEAYERAKEEQMTIARISALSVDYICIYTVDPVTDHYVEYSTSKEYAGLGISKSGDHFFEDAYKNAEEVIDPDDVDRVRSLLVKEKVLQNIEKTGLYSFNYRLLIGGEPTYVSLKAALVKEGDSNQLIIGISNINDQVKRDREYAYNLSMAKIRADIDALTGVKNRHAYLDFEDKLNASIKEKKNYPFAVTVFDVNDLKMMNDEHGHHEGDRLIRDASAIICTKFKHSPVFRIGGDEFVAVSSGQDYELIDSILKDFDKTNTLNAKDGKVVVSFGMSRFDGDSSVDNVFDRADINMYEYKKNFKAEFKKSK
ncbi:MAG: GGDEF domain-containing protein, partial [Spirochaetales bacterium]